MFSLYQNFRQVAMFFAKKKKKKTLKKAFTHRVKTALIAVFLCLFLYPSRILPFCQLLTANNVDYFAKC